MRIKMCSIHVRDPKQAFEFYTQTLGFQELVNLPEHHLFIVKSPDDPEGVGLLLEPSDHPLARAYMEGLYKEQMPTIVFGVKNVVAEFERLSAKGVKFKGPPSGDTTGTSAFFDDTCGNFVQLHQD